jgi:hypothetical protein
MSTEPPECNWPSGHEWEEPSRVRLMDDDTIRLVQECRWCFRERFGVPIYVVTWYYPEDRR